jgi:hypothetical protein
MLRYSNNGIFIKQSLKYEDNILLGFDAVLLGFASHMAVILIITAGTT